MKFETVKANEKLFLIGVEGLEPGWKNSFRDEIHGKTDIPDGSYKFTYHSCDFSDEPIDKSDIHSPNLKLFEYDTFTFKSQDLCDYQKAMNKNLNNQKKYIEMNKQYKNMLVKKKKSIIVRIK